MNAARQSRNRRLNRLKGLNELNEENDIGNFVAGCEELGLLQYRAQQGKAKSCGQNHGKGMGRG
jgi:hypothetical protein